MCKIITFHGTDHKCGASMISQCVAERIAEKLSEQNVLLVHMENAYGLDFSPKASESVGCIAAYLLDMLVDMEELFVKSRYKANLHIIGGDPAPRSEEIYSPSLGRLFLEELSAKFAYIICDSGCSIEKALSIGAIQAANHRLLVTTQSENALRRFGLREKYYKKLEFTFDGLIINDFSTTLVNTPELLAQRLGFEAGQLFCIKHSAHADEAEHDGSSLLAYREKSFVRSIDSVVDYVLTKGN